VTSSWQQYFDTLGDQSQLYPLQATVYVESLAAVGVRHHYRVLDFGCGFGFVTALLAARVAEVFWWEPSANMRAVAERNTRHLHNIRFIDLSALPLADHEDAPQHPRFDMILVNSVVQYMAIEELEGWLPLWREMLAPRGSLVLSDLIAPNHSGLSDIVDLFRLGVRYGSPLQAANEAIGGVAHYWRTSRAVPLTRISRDNLTTAAAKAGLTTEFLANNLTHFRKRWAAVLRRRTQV
jgi:cyclopropane fatty-acyl-phospholipid synthase-like methyltransferase